MAERYPWVRDWTPVNEPLTTARFSALYGYWYPHTTDEGAFWVALLNEIDATRLAMREIRRVNPDARLIQTDDLGFCWATPPLQAEADFQNERRWAGWDLLCGTVVPGHALWNRLCAFGLEDRLLEIADDPCPPDVIGINHYLSSERLLDHRVDLRADRSAADKELGDLNGLKFVDVDAIRNREEGVLGFPALLRQAAERYGRTIAITECHNGATREEQIRWFVEVWESAKTLRAEGVDLAAVTAWSLLGSHDWNRMVTRFVGHYEPGVYDVRGGEPRPTVMASVLRSLASGETPGAPGLDVPGWWRRPSRLLGAGPCETPAYQVVPGSPEATERTPLMIVGDGDHLLTLLAIRACEVRGLWWTLSDRASAAELDALRPWAVLDVRDAQGPAAALAWRCARSGVRYALVTGTNRVPSPHDALVVRTGPVFAPWDAEVDAVRWLDALDAGEIVAVDGDRPWRDVYGPDLMDGTLDLLIDGLTGPVDFRPCEGWSEADFVAALAAEADAEPGLLHVRGRPADPRPTARTGWLPPGETTVERFVREGRAARREGLFGVSRRTDEPRLEAAE